MCKVSVALLLFFVLSSCTIRSNFKTCKQSSFCSNNRSKGTDLQLVPKSIKQNGTTISAELQSTLKNFAEFDEKISKVVVHEKKVTYSLNLTVYKGGVVRLQITEKNPVKPRFSAADSLPVLLKENLIGNPISKISNDKIDVQSGNIRIVQSTTKTGHFALDFFDGTEKIMSFNSMDLFKMEPMQNRPNFDEKMPFKQKKNNTLNKPHEKKFSGNDTSKVNSTQEIKSEEDKEYDLLVEKWKERKSELDKIKSLWVEQFNSFKDNKRDGPKSVNGDIVFPNSLAVVGLAEHATSLVLKSTTGKKAEYEEPYHFYNIDAFQYELDDPLALYGTVPIIISHSPARTVGAFWLNPSETWVDVTDLNSAKGVHWMSESGVLDLFVFVGPKPKDVLAQMAMTIGTTPRPSTWAISPQQCRWNYNSQQDVLDVVSKFDENNLPIDSIWLDIEHTDDKRYFTWNSIHFPNPKEMIDTVSATGRKMITIVDPHIKVDRFYSVYKDAEKNDFFIKFNGKNYEGHCWPGRSSWLDYLNPNVSKYWAEQFGLDKYKGSTGDLFIWNDMNEPSVFNGPETSIPRACIHYGNVEHRDLHNAYGLLQHAATFDGLRERNPNERPFVLSRSFFSGSQRTTAVWTGDNHSSFGHLMESVPMLLSLSMNGITFVGADIGGFFENPNPELLVRWYQLGAYYPFHRAHAHIDTKRREPYLYPDPVKSYIRDALYTRYQLLPFWSTLFAINDETGIPPMRPLFVQYPRDVKGLFVDDQFMVGDAILVKPVGAEGQEKTDVYLPGGENGNEIWYPYPRLGKALAGGKQITADTPLDSIPVFQRGGTIIPRKDRQRRSSAAMRKDPYTLVVALNKASKATGLLYVDDGHTYNYKRGDFIWRKFSFANNMLSSEAFRASQPSANEDWALATVERVIVRGIKNAPKSVVLVEAGKKVALSFTFDSQKETVTVKKPDCAIKNDWKILFDY